MQHLFAALFYGALVVGCLSHAGVLEDGHLVLACGLYFGALCGGWLGWAVAASIAERVHRRQRSDIQDMQADLDDLREANDELFRAVRTLREKERRQKAFSVLFRPVRSYDAADPTPVN